MRVLIYMDGGRLKPIGGAVGYLYYLQEGLRQNFLEEDITIDFLPELSHEEMKKADRKNEVYKKLPSLFSEIRKTAYERRKVNRLFKESNTHQASVDLSSYDIVHFHCTNDLYGVRDSLKNYKGIVLLTCHSPKPFYQEVWEDSYDSFERKFLKKEKKLLPKIDEFAFRNANYLVFPCEGAREPYRVWDYFNQIAEEKFRYMLSGVCKPKVGKVDKRKELSIGEKEFVCSYVGRHNEVKGYDLLKDYLKDFMEQLHVVVCGKEQPIKGLEHKNWHEIGWTKEAMSYVQCADVFILPNRETYFDLVLLEVLSVGKICLISRTGGNKYFQNERDFPGIFTYSTKEEFQSGLKSIMMMSPQEKEALEQKNKELYEGLFHERAFAERYVELVKEIQKEKAL